MKKILVDTNVILDFALAREPFVNQAEAILELAFQKKIMALITASTITDIYYIARKEKDREFALAFIKSLLEIVDVASVDKKIISAATESELADFEDAVQDQAARQNNVDVIVTRNEKDFKKAVTEVMEPDKFLKLL